MRQVVEWGVILKPQNVPSNSPYTVPEALRSGRVLGD